MSHRTARAIFLGVPHSNDSGALWNRILVSFSPRLSESTQLSTILAEIRAVSEDFIKLENDIEVASVAESEVVQKSKYVDKAILVRYAHLAFVEMLTIAGTCVLGEDGLDRREHLCGVELRPSDVGSFCRSERTDLCLYTGLN
jgi:hypothetical protein